MDTLTRMRAFIAVVENEGFSAAARKIGRSKALLSKYVRELEDELGALLLNRTTRQFSLTELGHTYYKRAVEIVREIDTLQDMVRDSREGVRGRIKVSAPRSFADASLDQALIDFAVANPEIGLDIHLDDRFVDLVEEGFDLAIRVTTLEDSGPDRAAAGAVPGADRGDAGNHRASRHAGNPGGSRQPPLHRRHQCAAAQQLAVERPRRRNDRRLGFRADRGQQPVVGATCGACASGIWPFPGFHRAQGHRKRCAGGGVAGIHSERSGNLCGLSAPALSAGKGARFRRLPRRVVQDL